MKKISLTLFIFISAANLFAQFGAPLLVSPEIEGDSIIVRFRAPKAIKPGESA